MAGGSQEASAGRKALGWLQHRKRPEDVSPSREEVDPVAENRQGCVADLQAETLTERVSLDGRSGQEVESIATHAHRLPEAIGPEPGDPATRARV